MKTNKWIPCSSGNMPKCGEFDVKKVWATMHRKEVDFYFTKRLNWNNCYKRWEWLNGKELAEEWEVVAWMYVEVPKPYKGGMNMTVSDKIKTMSPEEIAYFFRHVFSTEDFLDNLYCEQCKAKHEKCPLGDDECFTMYTDLIKWFLSQPFEEVEKKLSEGRSTHFVRFSDL